MVQAYYKGDKMIQQDYKDSIQATKGVLETTDFTLEVNESMFQMLTSNVYNDTKLAVIREWSTNACDACIAAGKPVLYDVHIPTTEEPYFSVRDYGTGLSVDNVKGLFSTVGASTKRNSDAFNGQLGIGRLAGLAVADAFTVESFYEGFRHVYVVSMVKGFPSIMHMSSTPSTEPTGLKISVQVPVQDVHDYFEKAEYLYKYFDHKPNVNIDMSLHFKVTDQISEDCYVFSSPSRSSGTDNFVVMAQVPYRIPYDRSIENYGFTNLVVKVPSGSVTFNPGRESLSLNKRTVSYLNSMFTKTKNDYLDITKSALQNCTNDKELLDVYTAVYRAAPSTLRNLIDVKPYMSKELNAMVVFSNPIRVRQNSAFDALTKHTLLLFYKPSYKNRSSQLSSTITWEQLYKAQHVIIDVRTGFTSSLNAHFSGFSLICWKKAADTDITIAVQEAKSYLKALGIEYLLASDIIKDRGDKETTTKTVRNGVYASDVNYRGVIYPSEKMEAKKVSEDKYLYLQLSGKSPVLHKQYKFDTLLNAYHYLSLVEDTPPIKGVPKKYQPAVNRLSNWIDFETYILERIKQVVVKVLADAPVPKPFIRVSEKILLPTDLAELNNELGAYRHYMSQKDVVTNEEILKQLTLLGASFQKYDLSNMPDTEILKKKYKVSLPILLGEVYPLPTPFLGQLIELEEYYAVHSAQQ